MTREHSALAALVPPLAVLVPIVDHGQEIAQHRAEAALMAHAGEKRRRDFALGRACAHDALARLGHADAVVGRAPSGAPIWPRGIVGAITHTRGFAAALAGPTEVFGAIGLDAERVSAMDDDDALARRLFVPSELDLLAAMDAPCRSLTATLLFSAKEAYYKLLHPLTGWRLDFRQIEIVPGDGTFSARQPKAADDWHQPLNGRFAVMDDLVVTAIFLHAPLECEG